MFRMNRIGIQRRPIRKDCHKARIKRSGKTNFIKADLETYNPGQQIFQSTQQIHMIAPCGLVNVSPVFPNYDVCKHIVLNAVTGDKRQVAGFF